jgi:hypothetical protein
MLVDQKLDILYEQTEKANELLSNIREQIALLGSQRSALDQRIVGSGGSGNAHLPKGVPGKAVAAEQPEDVKQGQRAPTRGEITLKLFMAGVLVGFIALTLSNLRMAEWFARHVLAAVATALLTASIVLFVGGGPESSAVVGAISGLIGGAILSKVS